MTFAEMIAFNREKLGLSKLDFAKKCGLPVELLSYLEDPEGSAERFIGQCAAALEMKVEVFTGLEEAELSLVEKMEELISAARFPNIRQFLLDPDQCVDPEKALSLFSGNKVSMAERNLMLYLSTTALYQFCDSNTSAFGFDEYLFKLHNTLFERCEKEIAKLTIPEEEKTDRIDQARQSVFACDSMENIAIRIVEPFAEELEKRLPSEQERFSEDLSLPLKWDIDDELMKIHILNPDGSVKDEIKLLSVKEREK